MASPVRLGEMRLDRLARYLLGHADLVLVYPHAEAPSGSRVYVDANWAEVPDRYSTHAGVELAGEHLIDSWVTTDQVRALSTAEAELYGIVDGGAHGLETRHVHGECGLDWSVEVDCDASAAIA
eukprot:6223808-Lingulodinium_polyedra.AAC.1